MLGKSFYYNKKIKKKAKIKKLKKFRLLISRLSFKLKRKKKIVSLFYHLENLNRRKNTVLLRTKALKTISNIKKKFSNIVFIKQVKHTKRRRY